jgi:hypothetical protein
MKSFPSSSSCSCSSSKENLGSRTRSRTRRISPATPFAVLSAVLLSILAARAQTTNGLSSAEIKGRQLARKILDQLAQLPDAGLTNTGVLAIRDDNGQTTRVPVAFKIIVTATNWQTIYEATTKDGVEKLTIVRGPDQAGELSYVSAVPFSMFGGGPLLDHPFAGSDFTVGDLDLAFFGWPEQKLLPKTTELKRGRSYRLLESTNPHPSANGYSRVVSWIDQETDGILEAEAYDDRGRLLKEFYPKDFKKVHGQWELQSMEMDNDRTGSRSRLEFDLKK